jgi:hypothetical protein
LLLLLRAKTIGKICLRVTAINLFIFIWCFVQNGKGKCGEGINLKRLDVNVKNGGLWKCYRLYPLKLFPA